MQISAAIGSVTNYKSRITIPGVLSDRNYITSASLTPPLGFSIPGYIAPISDNFAIPREKKKYCDSRIRTRDALLIFAKYLAEITLVINITTAGPRR